MKRAIITPTYEEHFKYVKNYLKSYEYYVKDKYKFDLVFIIENKDKKSFEEIIKQYKKYNINVLIFDDLLKFYDIQLTPEQILDKYKKYSYQTLKKFLSMDYLNYDQMLILDSESMFIRETSVNDLFDEFFSKPYIAISNLKDMYKIDFFKKAVIFNYNLILKNYIDIWFLETFSWFYDKNILNTMFEKYGSPFKIINDIYNKTKDNYIEAGCFEICLYQAYIFLNNKQFGYNIIDTYKLLKDNLTTIQFKQYNNNYYLKFLGGTGFLEHSMLLANRNNVESISNILKNSKFNILRCEKTDINNYEIQKILINIVKPNILAASQRHVFGINNNKKMKMYLFFYRNNIFVKNVYHQLYIAKKPINTIIIWGKSIFYIVKYTIYWLVSIIKIIAKIF